MDTSHSWRAVAVLLPLGLASACSPVERAPQDADGPAELAIKGYDPVAYFNVGPGKAEYEYEWDGERYRFANVENMARFKADPGRYVPRFGNNCTGALALGLALEADPEIWRIHEGRLYIFGSLGSRDVFDKDPKGVISAAEHNAVRLQRAELLITEIEAPPGFQEAIHFIHEQCSSDLPAQQACHRKAADLLMAKYQASKAAEPAKQAATQP